MGNHVAVGHVVLLGDSVFDNAAYVAGAPDDVGQVRQRWPPGIKATLAAVDGSTMRDAHHQLRRVPVRGAWCRAAEPAALRSFRRRDTTSQAASLWKVLQTQEWLRDSDEETGGRECALQLRRRKPPEAAIDEHNDAWRSFFAGCASEPVRVVYEDLVEDYRGTVERVVREVGIPVPDDFAPVEPRMRRQAGELSEEWVRLYEEGRAARTIIHAGGV